MIIKVEGQVIQVREFVDKKTGEVTPVADLLVMVPGKQAQVVPMYCRDLKKVDIEKMIGKLTQFQCWASVTSLSFQSDKKSA